MFRQVIDTSSSSVPRTQTLPRAPSVQVINRRAAATMTGFTGSPHGV
jgi:hypothetical protein